MEKQIAVLNQINWDGHLNAHISHIRATKYKEKSWLWGPMRKSTTTTGPYTVWLASNWGNWGLYNQAANLLHETIHQYQYERGELDPIRYIFDYSHRYQTEVEAEWMNVLFAIRTGKVTNKKILLSKISPMNPVAMAADEVCTETRRKHLFNDTFNFYYTKAVHQWELWDKYGRGNT